MPGQIIKTSLWQGHAVDGVPIEGCLRDRDTAKAFLFLGNRRYSRASIAAFTGLADTRARAIANRSQKVTAYDVLHHSKLGARPHNGRIVFRIDGDLLDDLADHSKLVRSRGTDAIPAAVVWLAVDGLDAQCAR